MPQGVRVRLPPLALARGVTSVPRGGRRRGLEEPLEVAGAGRVAVGPGTDEHFLERGGLVGEVSLGEPDLDRDGAVGGTDLAILLSRWGPVP